MNKYTKLLALLATASICTFQSGLLMAERNFIRAVENLGDPRGYCFDIPGFGDYLRPDAPLGTHSCKYGIPYFWNDELFVLTDKNHLEMTEYPYCVAVKEAQGVKQLRLVDCKVGNLPTWRLDDSGRLSASGNDNLCVTLGSEPRYVNTPENVVPAYSSRSLTLQPCSESQTALQKFRWADPMEQTSTSLNSLRETIPQDIRNALATAGPMPSIAEIQQIYAGSSKRFHDADISVSDPIFYGEDEQHQLQIYRGINRNSPSRLAPVLVLVHGGGFTSGGLSSLTAVAKYFASIGYLVVNQTYPLAPEHRFPAGAEAVSQALSWVNQHIAEYEGNANRIFLLGHSAGGNHVANVVFRGAQFGAPVPLAGAILASPALLQDSTAAGEPEKAYFGENFASATLSLLNNIEDTDTPVLILTGEKDFEHMKSAAAMLIKTLIVDKGASPRYRQLPAHSHTSYVLGLGTVDRLAEEEIIDFIAESSR